MGSEMCIRDSTWPKLSGRDFPEPPRCAELDPARIDKGWSRGRRQCTQGVVAAEIHSGSSSSLPIGVFARQAPAMGLGACRCHQERDDAGCGGGQGVQADGGDLRAVHIRVGLRAGRLLWDLPRPRPPVASARTDGPTIWRCPSCGLRPLTAATRVRIPQGTPIVSIG